MGLLPNLGGLLSGDSANKRTGDVGATLFGRDMFNNILTQGGYGAYQAQMDANEKNVMLARENTAFQEKMSNTAYQRGMADMKKAGLNPMLAYSQGGASAPSGTPGHVEPEDKGKIAMGMLGNIKDIANLRQTNSAVKMNNAGVKKTDADTAVAKQVINNKKMEEWATEQSGYRDRMEAAKKKSEMDKLQEEVNITKNEREISDAGKEARKNAAKYLPYIGMANEATSATAKGAAAFYGIKKGMNINPKNGPKTGWRRGVLEIGDDVYYQGE